MAAGRLRWLTDLARAQPDAPWSLVGPDLVFRDAYLPTHNCVDVPRDITRVACRAAAQSLYRSFAAIT
jgi:hypothetical protein